MVKQYKGPRSATECVKKSPVKATKNIDLKLSLEVNEENKSNEQVVPVAIDAKLRQYKSPFDKTQPLDKDEPILQEPLLINNKSVNPVELNSIEDNKLKSENPFLVKASEVKPKMVSLVENIKIKPRKRLLAEKYHSKTQMLSINNNAMSEKKTIQNKKVKPIRLSLVSDSKVCVLGKKEDFQSKLDSIENKCQEAKTSNFGCLDNSFQIPLLTTVNHTTDSVLKTDDLNNKNNVQSQQHLTTSFVKHNDELLSTSIQSVLQISSQKVITDIITTDEKSSPYTKKLRSSNKSDKNNSGATSINTSPIVSVEHLVPTTVSNSALMINTRSNKLSLPMSSNSVCEEFNSNLAADLSDFQIHPKYRKIKNHLIDYKSLGYSFSEYASVVKAHIDNPGNVPLKNSYQMFLDLRKQIIDKQKNLFPIQPKPPTGFKDYLMNKRTYHLNGNSNSRVIYPRVLPPANLHVQLKSLFNEQEKERNKLFLQHVVQKEKLVLCVEQEILRVHGRAARELANQTLPFSACTFLKDKEVYSIPELKTKDLVTNAQSHHDGSIFLSWLQEVDDKWEYIKESMIKRHRHEAESLHAVQKMYWGWKLKEIQLCPSSSELHIDKYHVPIVRVTDDFNLLVT